LARTPPDEPRDCRETDWSHRDENRPHSKSSLGHAQVPHESQSHRPADARPEYHTTRLSWGMELHDLARQETASQTQIGNHTLFKLFCGGPLAHLATHFQPVWARWRRCFAMAALTSTASRSTRCSLAGHTKG